MLSFLCSLWLMMNTKHPWLHEISHSQMCSKQSETLADTQTNKLFEKSVVQNNMQSTLMAGTLSNPLTTITMSVFCEIDSSITDTMFNNTVHCLRECYICLPQAKHSGHKACYDVTVWWNSVRPEKVEWMKKTARDTASFETGIRLSGFQVQSLHFLLSMTLILMQNCRYMIMPLPFQ